MATAEPKETPIPKSAPAVIFIRHGKTAMNHDDKNKDRIRGWNDIPLTAEGIKESKEVAKKLARYPITKFYSSDLGRAKKTAEIINVYHHVPIKLTQDLRPWHLGIYQGKPTADAIPEIEKFLRNEKKKVPEGESFEEFRTKTLLTVTSIIKEALKKDSFIAITTHYRDLKLVQAWVTNGLPKDLSVDTDVMLTDGHGTSEIYVFPLDKYES